MAITVGDIYTQFPTFKPEDMIKLMNGRTDFTGRDTVSLANIAAYKGQFAQELSVFTAKREGKSFVNMYSDDKRQEIAQAANINTDNKNGGKEQQKPVPGYIPMDTSVFDIAKQTEFA